METKKCPTCGKEKPTSAFHRNKSNPSGLASQCSACRKAYTVVYNAKLSARTELPPAPQTKRCPCCGETKDGSCFSRNRSNVDGMTAYCRTCNGKQLKQRSVLLSSRTHIEIPAFKGCATCRQTLPASEFTRDRTQRDGLCWQCKSCVLDQRRKLKYGVDSSVFSRMMDEQGASCKICRRTEPGGRGQWAIDHDHTTGRVRGVLCQKCNLSLGLAGDNPDTLVAMANYVLGGRQVYGRILHD